MKKFVLVLILLSVVSCAANLESPVLYLSNASSDRVRNIECNWNGNLLTLAALNPGDTRSQSFFVRSDVEFFGPVVLSWYNGKGDRVSKSFNFKKENLPSINDKTLYNYVQLYLDQEDAEIVSSDIPDLTGKVRRMEQVMNRYHDEFIKSGVTANFCANNNMNICQNADNSGLIAVKKKQIELTPGAY